MNGSGHLDGNNFVESDQENANWKWGNEDYEDQNEGNESDWDSAEAMTTIVRRDGVLV